MQGRVKYVFIITGSLALIDSDSPEVAKNAWPLVLNLALHILIRPLAQRWPTSAQFTGAIQRRPLQFRALPREGPCALFGAGMSAAVLLEPRPVGESLRGSPSSP